MLKTLLLYLPALHNRKYFHCLHQPFISVSTISINFHSNTNQIFFVIYHSLESMIWSLGRIIYLLRSREFPFSHLPHRNEKKEIYFIITRNMYDNRHHERLTKSIQKREKIMYSLLLKLTSIGFILLWLSYIYFFYSFHY